MDIVDEALAGASVRRRALGATAVVTAGLTALPAQRYGQARPGVSLVNPEFQPLELHNHLKSDRPTAWRLREPAGRCPAL